MNQLSYLRLNSMVAIFLLLSSSAFAQDGLLASTNEADFSSAQSMSSDAVDNVIVDSNSDYQSYPSMEEEMKMYMELMSDEPRAFFFPNPSKGIVWLEHNLGKICKVTISDKNGSILLTALNYESQKLDLSSFMKGEYLIEVSNGDKRVTRSLTVR